MEIKEALKKYHKEYETEQEPPVYQTEEGIYFKDGIGQSEKVSSEDTSMTEESNLSEKK